MALFSLQTHSTEDRTDTASADLIKAFHRVIAKNGRRQATDLHVRRLLKYVQAKDFDGTGVQRSLKQLSNILVLNVSTCRRVIRRAVEHFGLLTVIAQRHVPGGQTFNRYTINWKNVDALLCEGSSDLPESRAIPISRMALAAVSTGLTCLRPVGSSDLSSEAKIEILKSRARSKRFLPASESTFPENTDMPVRLALPVGSCSKPEQAQRISVNSSSVPAGTIDELPVVKPPDNTLYESLFYTHTGPSGSNLGGILNGGHPDGPISMDNSLNHCGPKPRTSHVRLALDLHAGAPVFYDQPPPTLWDNVFARIARTPHPSALNFKPCRQVPPLTTRLPPQITRQNHASAPLMLATPTNRLATTFKRLPPQITRL